jgi:hypothetical protein
MTELSFLIELLLNHDLPKATKDLIASRIKEVEQTLTATRIPFVATSQVQNVPPKLQQAASTLAAMAKHGDIPPQPVMAPETPPAPHIPTLEENMARQNAIELIKKRKQGQHLKF